MKAKRLIIEIVVVALFLGCTHNSESNYHFVPIVKDGEVYAYISAMTYGLAGGHDRIIVLQDTTQIDSNYIFYRDHLFYKIDDHLEIVLLDFPSSKDIVYGIEGIDVKLLNQLDYISFLDHYKEDGYTMVETRYYNR